MMEVFTQNSKKIAALVIIASIFARCNNNKVPTTELIDSGGSYYNKTCLSCHAKAGTTLYHPSLEEMNQYGSTILIKKIDKVRMDSVHSKLFPQNFKADSLIEYINQYKKTDVIPNK